MTIAQSTPATHSEMNYSFAHGLNTEARELDELNSGLQRHVIAWKSAHESAVTHLTNVLARMDSILERIEREKSR